MPETEDLTAKPMLKRPRPEPRSAAVPVPPSMLPAAAAAGLAAAVQLPLDRPGLGWALTGLAAAAAIGYVHKRSADTPPHFTRMSPVWTIAALALLTAGFVRASEWLFVLCVIAACVTGSLAVVGRRSASSVLYEVLAVPIEALRSTPWLLRAIKLRAEGGDNEARRRIGVSILASVALLAVFVPLLSGADETFAHLVESMIPDVDTGTSFLWLAAFGVVGSGVVGACYLLAAPPPPATEDVARRRLTHRVEWALPLGVLVALFTTFVAVRLVVLFGGDDYMRRTSGLTAANYARGGFWQLCVITVLTLALVGAALRWAPKSTAADRTWQRALLGALSALSLVLVASALSRMWTYQQAYGFTVLRLLVEVCELWLGTVFVLVLVSLIRLHSTWLPRATVGAAAVALLALVALDPERFISDRNIDRAEQGKPVDIRYLSGFSADVLPAAERLPEPQRSCVLWKVTTSLDDDNWNAWNLSRSRARDVPKTEPPTDCSQ
jgi:ABC-type amino acid transport system permease subunit